MQFPAYMNLTATNKSYSSMWTSGTSVPYFDTFTVIKMSLQLAAWEPYKDVFFIARVLHQHWFWALVLFVLWFSFHLHFTYSRNPLPIKMSHVHQIAQVKVIVILKCKLYSASISCLSSWLSAQPLPHCHPYQSKEDKEKVLQSLKHDFFFELDPSTK